MGAARTEPEVYHAWRRIVDGDGLWEQVAGVKGGKLDALRMVETLERQGSFEDYEFCIIAGDDRPRMAPKMRPKWS